MPNKSKAMFLDSVKSVMKRTDQAFSNRFSVSYFSKSRWSGWFSSVKAGPDPMLRPNHNVKPKLCCYLGPKSCIVQGPIHEISVIAVRYR